VTSSISSISSTGIGSLPGTDAQDYAEAVKIAFGEVDLPFVPELPGRGVTAGMIGRSLALVTELGIDLQPAGWRLTDASGVDHRRARSLLAQDLDEVEAAAQGFDGVIKTAVTGPWTLAATVEKPRGDKVLSDAGARRELAQALADGITAHVRDVARRVTGGDPARVIVQLDEPALPAVLAARVPTASGFGRHRSVDLPVASAALEWVLGAVREAGATPIVHCCADDFAIGLVRGAGANGVSVDLDRLGAEQYDDLAQAIEEGDRVFLGVVPTTPTQRTERELTERVLRLLDMLGLEPVPTLGITPACGLGGATPEWAHEALRLSTAIAANLAR
jgi:methionine synthase II (cobalamin-independent)